jgi:hypothetical protein
MYAPTSTGTLVQLGRWIVRRRRSVSALVASAAGIGGLTGVFAGWAGGVLVGMIVGYVTLNFWYLLTTRTQSTRFEREPK